jgi:hypothetical protein
MPAPTTSTLGGIQSLTSTPHEWINALSTNGVPTATQPADTDIMGTTAGALPYVSNSVLAELSTTPYSVMASGATNPTWAVPTANGQCFMSGATNFATTTPSFQTCPSNGVASFSGDGTILKNSGSTGAVAATLQNAAAHTVLGNNTNSPAPPTYFTLNTDLGTLTYTASGTTTFAAAGAVNAAGIVTATHSTSTTFSPTGLVKWGSYVLEINQDSTGGGVTFTLGAGGSCSAWKIGGGSGAISLSSTAGAIDVLAWTFDGTNCVANFRTNFN